MKQFYFFFIVALSLIFSGCFKEKACTCTRDTYDSGVYQSTETVVYTVKGDLSKNTASGYCSGINSYQTSKTGISYIHKNCGL